jgi:hypothetical protein
MIGRIAACLVLFALCISATPFECTPQAADGDMPMCCWYSNSTCCPTDETGLLGAVSGFVNGLYDDMTDNGKNSNHTFEKCFTYVENFICTACSPDSPTFMDVSGADETGVTTITLCKDFCDSFYDACSDESLVGAVQMFAEQGIVDGKTLCLSFNDQGGDDTYSAVASSIDSESADTGDLPATTRTMRFSSIRQTRDLTDTVVYAVSSSNCFEGATPNEVGTSTCTPWAGDYEESSDGYWWYWVFIVGGVLGCCFFSVIVAIVVVGVLYWRKRQAAAVVTKGSTGGDYPNLEELDDE